MNAYTECIVKNQASGIYKDCVKLMDDFRFCILFNARKQ